MARKRVSRTKARVSRAAASDPLTNKIRITWKNLVLFAVLFAFSSLFESFSTSDFFITLFYTLSMIFGFVSFALVVALLVLFVVRANRK